MQLTYTIAHKRVPMDGALYKFVKEGVGTVSSVSAVDH